MRQDDARQVPPLSEAGEPEGPAGPDQEPAPRPDKADPPPLTERHLNIPQALAVRWVGNRAFPRRDQVIEELVGTGNLALVRAWREYDGVRGSLEGFLCWRVWLAFKSTYGNGKHNQEWRWAKLRSLDNLIYDDGHKKFQVDLVPCRGMPPDRELEVTDAVRQLFQGLSPRQREVAYMSLAEGKSSRVVARELGLSVGNVLYHLKRSQRVMTERLCKMEGIPVPEDSVPPIKASRLPAEKESLPSRRRTWRQKVRIGGTTFYLDCGEYDDGRLGEVFLSMSKTGSFSRGVVDTVARLISTALQCGMPVERLVHTLQLMNFPPNGEVIGSPRVTSCTSLPDWVAQEINAVYCSGMPAIPPVKPPEEKAAGYVSEDWRTGV